ncbi:T9SS type A sorting domain-containing protein [Pontibacter cellulosilyticus]|uniref:T9SS type A sorting domain-containing protein n=1 Tax=Pontibacter cellulosilyticus TaxID=1720253 RepID=A0A923N9Q4_9BACT|nr:T9SS type A sorting domain-containing protein [Pontibacter cellulosilyticus]MBC5993946.1 T9SS type A sorting domain-containing protein [Pontibacter cellulosilyticus]
MIKLYAAPIALTRTMLKLLFTILALITTTNLLADNSLHMVPISLEERTRKADIVIEGEVISQKSFWNADNTNIYTSNVIRVYKVFKGSVQEQQLELITQGGSVGLKKQVLSTALELYPGQQGIFLLMNEKEISSTPFKLKLHTRAYAGQQGFVKYNLKEVSAADAFNTYSSVQQLYNAITERTGSSYRVIQENTSLHKAIEAKRPGSEVQTQKSLLIPVITSFSPTVTTAGTDAVLTINGTNFGSTRGTGKVEFRNADDGGKTFMEPRPKDYISWTNTQIRVRIPSRGKDGGTAGSGEIRVTAADGSSIISATQIIIEFAVLNVALTQPNLRTFEPLLQNKNGKGGYTVRYAPSMQNRSAAREGFERALNTWTCATNVNWDVGSPTTIEAAKDDEISVIRFAQGSTFGQEGVLASTLSYWEGYRCGTDTVFWLSEFDMAINSNITWQYGPGGPTGNQYDFETVILHELGHAHQLGHVILPRAVMHYAVEVRALVRDLSDADIRGGNRVMARSTVPFSCNVPPEPMIPETQGDCNLAPEIFTFDGAFQGSQVVLNWVTQQEQNVNFYVIQRSADGSTWQDIAEVDAKGAGTYTYTDANPLNDISFYRLKLVYNDNSNSFSPRVRLINPSSLRRLQVFPNPVPPGTYSINLVYLVNSNTTLSLQLYSTTGKLVRDVNFTLSDVNEPIELSLRDLAAGVYILKWQERSNSGEFKIVKL